eukprot:CAMPEP_0117474538 /NCGR_PEP_ID=MMETSP0784-20121206/9334_1 /TAXON_ID=39447 /ORGANISM="" /LENGTH=60 /DNA_ID=CAMNT_0005268763 /DNA_START=153 /DNA_END=335 /DNA_ORIENTATION=-
MPVLNAPHRIEPYVPLHQMRKFKCSHAERKYLHRAIALDGRGKQLRVRVNGTIACSNVSK